MFTAIRLRRQWNVSRMPGVRYTRPRSAGSSRSMRRRGDGGCERSCHEQDGKWNLWKIVKRAYLEKVKEIIEEEKKNENS